MPDFRIADTAAEHAKMRAAGPAAVGLWAMAGAYAMNPAHLTDGWVPAYWVISWPSGKKLASTLVKVGLWREEARDGMQGWLFHDWTDIQRSADEIAAEKHANAVRRELYGSPKLIASIKERDQDRCRYCGRVVSWTNRRGSAGATFDHVVPMGQGGKNTLDNVVVACRGCNAGKKDRTPGQAGMALLNPPSELEQTQTGTSSETNTESDSELDNNSAPHPHPHPSSRDLGREGHLGNAHDRERPADRCPEHADVDKPPPCRRCLEARLGAEAWDRGQLRAKAEQRTADARQRDDTRRLAIANCALCTDDGYVGRQICNHDPAAAERAARGRAAVQAALNGHTQEAT